MKTKIKQIIKLLLPPLFLSLIRKTKEQNTFEGVYKDFSSIENVTDYDTKDSTNNVLLETVEKFKDSQGQDLLPKSHIRSNVTNLLPMLATILMTINKNTVSVLDFGGGMGTSFIDCLNSSIKYAGIKELLSKVVFELKIKRQSGFQESPRFHQRIVHLQSPLPGNQSHVTFSNSFLHIVPA